MDVRRSDALPIRGPIALAILYPSSWATRPSHPFNTLAASGSDTIACGPGCTGDLERSDALRQRREHAGVVVSCCKMRLAERQRRRRPPTTAPPCTLPRCRRDERQRMAVSTRSTRAAARHPWAEPRHERARELAVIASRTMRLRRLRRQITGVEAVVRQVGERVVHRVELLERHEEFRRQRGDRVVALLRFVRLVKGRWCGRIVGVGGGFIGHWEWVV